MEDRIRKMPEKVLDIAVFILFAVFALCPLVNFLIVCVEGVPDYSWGFVFMPNPIWESWDSFILYFGVAVSLLYWLKAYLRNAAPKLTKHPALILFLAFALWMALATCVNGLDKAALLGNEHRMEGVLTYFAYLVYFLIAALWKNDRLKRAWLWVFAGSAAVLELCLIADDFLLSGRLHIRECGAVFYNSNHFGYYILMSALVCAVGGVTAEKSWTRILWLVLSAIAVEALLLNDTQGAQIGFLFGLLLMALVCALTKHCPLRRAVWPFLVTAAVVALNKVLPAVASGGQKLDKNVQATIQQVQAVASGIENAPNSLGSGRLGLWRWTITRIRERPWVGYGSDALADAMTEALRNSRCHCEYMHYALSYGIPAAVLYVCGVFAVYLRGLRLRRTLTAEQIIGLCAAFGYMVSAAVGNTMWYTAPFAFILLGMGYGKTLDKGGEKG